MRTQTSWTFTPDEFAHVWAMETGLVGDYPHPINLAETPFTAEEYDRLHNDISARYPPHGDPDLIGPLRVLAAPELRIVCNGWSRSGGRVRSCATAVADLGVVLYQKSGATPEFGGDIKLVVTQRKQLGRHIAATMPTTAPGGAGLMHGYTPRVRGEQQPSTWVRDTAGRWPVEERIRQLLRAPRSIDGYLRIERGIGNPRPFPPEFLSWIDIREPDSLAGRYLITVAGNDTIVTPASAETIADEVSHRAELHT